MSNHYLFALAMLNYIQTVERTFGPLHKVYEYDTEFPMRDHAGIVIGSDHDAD